ncbi:hypothetical protein OROMI_003468 [Orobanche minor]
MIEVLSDKPLPLVHTTGSVSNYLSLANLSNRIETIRQFHSYLFTLRTISGHKGTAKRIAQARVPIASAGKG